MADMEEELQQDIEVKQTMYQDSMLSPKQLRQQLAGYRRLLLEIKLQFLLLVPEELARLDATLTLTEKQAGRQAYSEWRRQ